MQVSDQLSMVNYNRAVMDFMVTTDVEKFLLGQLDE
jgi:hypothetical protein